MLPGSFPLLWIALPLLPPLQMLPGGCPQSHQLSATLQQRHSDDVVRRRDAARSIGDRQQRKFDRQQFPPAVPTTATASNATAAATATADKNVVRYFYGFLKLTFCLLPRINCGTFIFSSLKRKPTQSKVLKTNWFIFESSPFLKIFFLL